MTAPTIGDTRRELERAQSGLTAPTETSAPGDIVTAPTETDGDTIEALAEHLDTTPADLLAHAAESVRAPTETPSPDCEMCEGQAPPVLEGVVQHCEGCSEPSLTTEQARVSSSRFTAWASVPHVDPRGCVSCGVSGNTNDLDLDSRCVDHAALDPLESDEVDQLFAWVRARMAALRVEHPYMIGDDYERGWLLCHIWGELPLKLADAGALCESAGWPS